ncbi:glycosyltransferase family 4 protein [Chryseobacterium sp. YR221]|uniref:glycosyltransferase family 4 protein n=1 Tax=Chryseobacterium sp. YR221 TaxID=1500293 RepID=UPI0009D8D7B6|nr:glycosyltransferase family 4 protein [Chryseobacterium sp. YR221]SMC99461.1 Glycosyltransferase involved in cell wall bisynthesis [Chryseobacterium sp. YR221]
MKKILFFTKYSPMGASSRLRSFQFFPSLEEKKYVVHHSSLLGNKYLGALYRNEKTKSMYLILGYLKRLYTLLSVKKYDIVVIEKELFPYLPAWAEIRLKKAGVDYFVDYDDAIFHNYDLSGNRFIKKHLSDKIDLVMKNSKCVFAGNSYLAKRAEMAKAPRIMILPTVIDAKKYYKINNKDDQYFTLGWIGSPSTYKYIEELFPVFYELKKEFPNFRVNIIGAKQTEETKDFIHFIPWTEESEVEEINKFDLGIMPLHETPWELGKCSYKLIQYMGCSIAVLASPVGMNTDIVIPGYNGELVKDKDWYSGIKKYIEHKDKTITQGKKGRVLIESKYNREHNINKILTEFEN